ncbi:hypothetical protein NKG05_14920 [Oerskovia sp. M15]
MSNHLTYTQEVDAEVAPVLGNVYFSAKHVPADPQGSMSRVLEDHYRYPALVPASPKLPAQPVRTPVLAWAGWRDDGVRVHWTDAGGRRFRRRPSRSTGSTGGSRRSTSRTRRTWSRRSGQSGECSRTTSTRPRCAGSGTPTW